MLIFDNPTDNILWYFHSSWRDDYEEQLRRKEKYADQADWKEFLIEREDALLKSANALGINSSKIANLKSIKRWPNPSQMAALDSKIACNPERKKLFEYLNDWYYHSLSAASHLSGNQLIPAMHLLSGSRVTGPYAFTPQLYKSDAISTVDTLFLAVLSECIIELGLTKVEDAKYIWTLLSEGIAPYAKGLYKLRYQTLLREKGT